MYCFRSLSCGKGRASLVAHARETTFISTQSHQVLEDEHEALVGVDDVVQGDDVGVFEVLQ